MGMKLSLVIGILKHMSVRAEFDADFAVLPIPTIAIGSHCRA